MKNNLKNIGVEKVLLGSFNCQGAIRNVAYIAHLLENLKIDILCLSEHWLFPNSLCFLDSVSSDFCSHGVSDSGLDISDPFRRGKGGVAIMWRKSLNNNVTLLPIENDRLMGISLQVDNNSYVTILATYLPSANADFNVYLEYLNIVRDTYVFYSETSEVFVCGDLNGELFGPRYQNARHDSRSKALYEMASMLHLNSLPTLSGCIGPSYTFCPYDGGPQSLIDHILIRVNSLDIVNHYEVLDDCALNVSDHLPVITEFNTNILCSKENDYTPVRLMWERLNKSSIFETYTSRVSNALQNIEKQPLTNTTAVEAFYDKIVYHLNVAASESIPVAAYNPHIKPFWKKGLKSFHKDMTERRHEWIQQGRPRGPTHASFVSYKKAKRVFRLNMRKLYHENENRFYEELEKSSEIDQSKFWSILNRRRKRKSSVRCQLKVGDNVYRSSDERLGVWVDYFRDLYSDTSHGGTEYDNLHHDQITSAVNQIKKARDESDDIINESNLFTTEEIEREMRSLKLGKKGGFDGLTYEHIKYGGTCLAEHLVLLFNGMYTNECMPSAMKRGLIVTLYKGSRKYEDDRKNYRGISLLPVLNKLFEKLILKRLKFWIDLKKINFPSLNQNAYQTGLCSLLASFELQECINYNLERQSDIYICLLDSSSAFDTVWHTGLFYKLYMLGVKGKTWRMLLNSYQGMVSNVVQDGKVSDVIPIRQSVRQGSILGPWYYLLYIHELAVNLITSDYVARVGQVKSGAVLQADDLALAALTANGLQVLVSSCETYSRKWRFTYNPIKSKMMIFKSTRLKQKNSSPTVKLYGQVLETVDSYTHVGVTLNAHKNMCHGPAEAANKARGCLMSILGSNINLRDLGCISAMKLYHSIVLPRSLYGAELWHRTLSCEIQDLNVAHRFCLKKIQSLPKRAKSVIVESMAKSYCIEAYVDKRKLSFIGRLCRLNCFTLAKKIFIERLYQNNVIPERRHSGIVCELLKVVAKYNLMSHVTEFMATVEFPSKRLWKSLVDKSVSDFEEKRVNEAFLDTSLERFHNVYGDQLQFHVVWRMEKTLKQPCFRDLAKLNCVIVDISEQICCYCEQSYTDQIVHYVQYCSKYTETRELYWSLVVNTCSVQLSSYLYNLEDERLVEILLGKSLDLAIPTLDADHLLTLGAKTWQILSREPQLHFYSRLT